MRKVLLGIYPNYADFQIGHLLFFLKKVGKVEIVTATVDGESVVSLGGLCVKPDLSMDQVDVNMYDLVLFPGGDGIHHVADYASLHDLLQRTSKQGIPIASLCGSTLFLAKAGLLHGKKFTCNQGTFEHFQSDYANGIYTGSQVEVELGTITAKGTAFADFTIEVGRLLNLWKNDEDVDRALAFCKGEL